MPGISLTVHGPPPWPSAPAPLAQSGTKPPAPGWYHSFYIQKGNLVDIRLKFRNPASWYGETDASFNSTLTQQIRVDCVPG